VDIEGTATRTGGEVVRAAPAAADPQSEIVGDKAGRVRLMIAGVAAACIFIVDTFTTLQSAVAVLYVLVLVIADDGVTRTPVVRHAGVCALLAVLGFAINHGPAETGGPLLRLVISLAAIAVTSALIVRNRRVQLAARANDLRYRNIFDTIAVSIWEHDFTEVKRGIDAVRASGVVDLRSYLEEHPEFVIAMRRAVRIADVNDAALRLLKVPTKAQFFSHLADFLPEEDGSFVDGILAIDEGRAVFETETQFRAMTGEYVDVFVNLSFPPNGAGLDRVCGSIMDVTDRRRVQEALERTRSELDQAIRAATVGELSASIAHEVSQPILAVRAYVDAARRWLTRNPPDAGEALTAIHEAARAAGDAGEVVDRVRRLIGRSAPECRPLDIDSVVRRALELAQRQLNGTTLEVDLVARGRTVAGDAMLLQQVFLNVFNNSLQAMDGAGVADRRMHVGSRVEDGRAIVTISDSGPGISDEIVARAFNPLANTGEGGIGIGLAMCRSIVMAHGGTMDIGRSAPLKGALVEIGLPLVRH
jgi:two-component system sensor kinase FixL